MSGTGIKWLAICTPTKESIARPQPLFKCALSQRLSTASAGWSSSQFSVNPRPLLDGHYSSMKWLYIIFGILGGLVPATYIFSRVSSNRLLSEPDLVLFSLGIGIIVAPLFMCLGIVIARIAELCLGFLRSTKRGSRHIPDWP